MVQEIKTEEKNFPFDEFKKQGYQSYVFGQKSYNGVALISKVKIDEIKTDYLKDERKQSRVITGLIKYKSKDIKIINIYVPNGNPIDTDKYVYKKNWLNTFIKKTKKELLKNSNILIGGDFNIIPDEIDAHDYTRYEKDALFVLEIRKKFQELINLGLHDAYRYLYKNKQEYTFWDYMSGAWQKNNGLRIDHFLISNNLLDIVKDINIDKKPRSKIKPSDHTPIEIVLS